CAALGGGSRLWLEGHDPAAEYWRPTRLHLGRTKDFEGKDPGRHDRVAGGGVRGTRPGGSIQGMSEESHGALLCHPTFVSYQKSESFVQRVCLEPSGRTRNGGKQRD